VGEEAAGAAAAPARRSETSTSTFETERRWIF
jgi:hypothetical protein